MITDRFRETLVCLFDTNFRNGCRFLIYLQCLHIKGAIGQAADISNI